MQTDSALVFGAGRQFPVYATEMRREYIKWYSPSLQRDMELLAYGERGFPVCVFPTSGGRFFEYEDRGMVNALAPKIDRGDMQLICVDSVDSESWYNKSIHPADRLHRHNAYDAYFTLEIAPFVRRRTSWPQMGLTGCSFGGYHAINLALRHPDLVTYSVSMSGAFNIPQQFLDGFYNDDAYFHSPLDNLPNLNDAGLLDRIRRNYFVLAVGNQDSLFDQNVKLAHALGTKGIPHLLDVWEGFGHDWPWWYQMAQKFFIER
jgi:esterase/lipase superfamily enzyme